MKLPKRLALYLWLACGLVRPACADVYAYIEESGTTILSNVAADEHYRVLVSEGGRDSGSAANLWRKGSTVRSMAGKAGYDDIVAQAASAYGLESALLHAVISVESHYNPMAVSKKGASGLMQLMPDTARRYGVVDSFDPTQNVAGGARYLRDLLVLFDSDVGLALAAYNAGENNVIKYGKRVPPFRETKEYVPRVLGLYRKYQSPL